jgi:Tfp pilus assembly protein PilF
MKLLALLFCLMLVSSVFAQNTDLALMRSKLEAGDFKTVIVQLEPFVKLKPNDPEAHFLLARAYYLTGGALNQARAEDQIRLAIKLVAFRAEFEWQYGLILEALGRADQGDGRSSGGLKLEFVPLRDGLGWRGMAQR